MWGICYDYVGRILNVHDGGVIILLKAAGQAIKEWHFPKSN